jgi:DNA-binding transcriptional MerR regulator
MEAIEGSVQIEAGYPAKSLLRIGEVSRLTATKPFVLRYWETEFPMLQPVKSPKGHRLYRREDIDTVFTIKRLLYNEGFTIAGARRHLREQGRGQGAGMIGGNDSLSDTNMLPTGATERSGQESSVRHTQPSDPLAMLNRKTLLDLRDSLRSLLTALESE